MHWIGIGIIFIFVLILCISIYGAIVVDNNTHVAGVTGIAILASIGLCCAIAVVYDEYSEKKNKLNVTD